jgi:hypothetical protein
MHVSISCLTGKAPSLTRQCRRSQKTPTARHTSTYTRNVTSNICQLAASAIGAHYARGCPRPKKSAADDPRFSKPSPRFRTSTFEGAAGIRGSAPGGSVVSMWNCARQGGTSEEEQRACIGLRHFFSTDYCCSGQERFPDISFFSFYPFLSPHGIGVRAMCRGWTWPLRESQV